MKSDLERLLQASIDQLHLQAKLDAAHEIILRQKRVMDSQANEIALYQARCRLADTRLQRLMQPRPTLQAG